MRLSIAAFLMLIDAKPTPSDLESSLNTAVDVLLWISRPSSSQIQLKWNGSNRRGGILGIPVVEFERAWDLPQYLPSTHRLAVRTMVENSLHEGFWNYFQSHSKSGSWRYVLKARVIVVHNMKLFKCIQWNIFKVILMIIKQLLTHYDIFTEIMSLNV